MDLFVSCAQDMESLLSEELVELGFANTSIGYRGVYVPDNSMEAIYKLNYCSRIAGRVLLPILRFRCRDRSALYDGIASINWKKYINLGKTFAIDANVSDNRNLRKSLFVAQVIKDAICDQFREKSGQRPTVDRLNPDVQLNVFIQNDQAVVNIDTSGTPLHRRGYRQADVEAPIRQSLAAALLRIAKFKGDEIVCDPCCGSGTFLIEAAMIATHTPAGFLRQKWGFMNLPEYNQVEWLKVKNQADAAKIPLQPNRFFGVDINKNAVHACKVNFRAAGFHQGIQVVQQDFRSWIPPQKPNFLITNPPHGNRLEEQEFLRPLYRSLGDFMKLQMTKPARGFIFTGNLELAKEVGLAPKRRIEIDNAGIDSRFLEFDLY